MGAGIVFSALGTAASGLMSYFNNKKAQQQADAEAARQQAYYEAKANENPLSRSENQHLLGQYDRQAQQQIENARGVAAITGATPEYSLAVQKAVANGRADLMGNMAAEASERADKYNQLGEQARHQKAMDDQARIAARNETFANLAANAANIVGSSFEIPIKDPTDYAKDAEELQKALQGGYIDQATYDKNMQKIQQGTAKYYKRRFG